MPDAANYADRAERLARQMRAEGWKVEIKHYPPSMDDRLDRYYVIVEVEGGCTVNVQYNQALGLGGALGSSFKPPYGSNNLPARYEEAGAALSRGAQASVC